METTRQEPPKPGDTLTCMQTNSPSDKSGYLLLEVCLALMITSVILAGVFKISEWNLQVSQDSIDSSNQQIKEAALFAFLDRAFLELSGDAVVRLESNETPDHYLSELIIQNSASAFTWPNQPFTFKAVKIITVPKRDKTLDIVIEYYADYLLDTPYERNAVTVLSDQEPIETLTLLENVFRFEWRTWDGSRIDHEGAELWEYTWENNSTSPRYFELNALFDLDGTGVIHTFWNPRKVNPTTYFQVQNRQNAQQSNPSN